MKYKIGDIVYLKTDLDQVERIVTGITIRPNNSFSYCLAFDTIETWHYDIEMSTEKDILKITTN